MNLRDITDKLKDTIVPKDMKKEENEASNTEKKENIEDKNMENEQKPISDEVEQMEEQPLRIKTMFVKSDEQDEEDTNKKKITGAVKVAVGVGLAAAGIAALILGSRKRKW